MEVRWRCTAQVRRRRVREALSGGRRPAYRSMPRVPLGEREWERPEGAGSRRGWELVRFAVFGEAGAHLREKPPAPEESGERLCGVRGVPHEQLCGLPKHRDGEGW